MGTAQQVNGAAPIAPPAPPPAPSTAVSVIPPQRATLTAYNDVALFDTAQFEHMQRVAVLMARTSMIPDALRMKDDEPLEDAVVIANCFMIVNQARHWRMDPFAVAQCCSIVHGRLMYEGKLVSAVLEANLGVRLHYTFDNAAGDQMGVVVSGVLPGETKPRTIDGKVADWHRGAKSPWAMPSAWKRQMRYMGAREWARAYAPAIMLGVIAIEEATDDGYVGAQPQRSRAVTPLNVVPPPPPPPPALEGETEPEPEDTGSEADDTIFDPESFVDALDEEMALAGDMDTLSEIWADAQPFVTYRISNSEKRRAHTVHEAHIRRIEEQ